MHLHLSNSLFFGCNDSHLRNPCFFPSVSACLETRARRVTSPKVVASPVLSFDKTKERISKLIRKTELSISTYDTTWVAMVPSPSSPHEPYFPDCLNWLLENQCCDGSWARPHHHSLLQKDVISSTLACVLALKKWGVGEEQINRGVHFIELNFASAIEKSQISPMGFDIIFPTMLDYARDLFLNLRLEPTTLNDLIHKREWELNSYKDCTSPSAENEAYLAYIAEGMGKLQDWETVMKYQRKNGSLFNSPSTTAAAFMSLPNSDCLNYLQSALTKFGNSVPAVYPLDIYSRLSTVDNLERLGISRYFTKEIQSMLDETYRCWVQGDEEIFMDASTCALAFRLLRLNGYNVTSEEGIENDVAKMKQFVLSKLGNVSNEIRAVFEETDSDSMIWFQLKFRHPWDLLWGNISKDGVCITGDALHPMTPDIGQGGCSALEDAVVLARVLGEAFEGESSGGGARENGGEIEHRRRIVMGLKKFGRERRWRSVKLVSVAYLVGFVQQSDGVLISFLRDKLVPRFLARLLLKMSDFDCGKLKNDS